jgi:Protein of unknown function (DUF4230)
MRFCSGVILFFALLFCSCGKGDRLRKQEILGLREMNELATVEYTVTRIIKATDDQTWWKFGDRKILMNCKATLKAGIDLSQLTEADITIEGKRVEVRLPPAKLQTINILPQDLQVAYEEVGVFRSSFTEREREILAARAQQQMEASAEEIGILTEAEKNAALTMRKILQGMGYEDITVTSMRNTSTTKPLP